MAIKWEYRAAENYQQADETKIESMLRWLNANGREGWEFDRIVEFANDEKFYLLLQRQSQQ